MKLQLPITPRYLLPILIALVVLDCAVATGVAVALYRVGQRVLTFEVDNMECTAYAPSFGRTLYLVSRCTEGDKP